MSLDATEQQRRKKGGDGRSVQDSTNVRNMIVYASERMRSIDSLIKSLRDVRSAFGNRAERASRVVLENRQQPENTAKELTHFLVTLIKSCVPR